MRRFAGTLTVVLALLAGCGTGSDPDPEVTPKTCRAAWADLARHHGEHGPGGSLTELTARWDDHYDRASTLARTASEKDCGPVLARFTMEWAALERFMYDLLPFDMPHQLTVAEGDRWHYVERHRQQGDYAGLPQGIPGAFRVLRHQAPLAAEDLAPTFDRADQVDVTDADETREFVAEVVAASDRSRHYALCQKMLRRIFVGERLQA